MIEKPRIIVCQSGGGIFYLKLIIVHREHHTIITLEGMDALPVHAPFFSLPEAKQAFP